MNIDKIRKRHLAVAEWIDAWRIAPRLLIIGYGYLLYDVVNWFMVLEDPSVAQAGLVSVVVGGAAAVFGLYSNSSRSWKNGFTKWSESSDKGIDESDQECD